MSIPPELLGPTGALIGAILIILALARVIQQLWRDHLEADRDDRTQRDQAQELLRAEQATNRSLADGQAQIARDLVDLTDSHLQLAKDVRDFRAEVRRRRP